MQNSTQNFVNPAFAAIYEGITAKMPSITFYGIVATYLVTAALNCYFIPLPLYLSVPAALALQFGRFAIVFMDFLNPTGTRSAWPPLIALAATVVALAELGFSIQDIGFTGPKFWAVFLFGGAVISFGYLLEVNFIGKGAEAFNMGHRSKPVGATSQTQTTTAQPFQVTQQPRYTLSPHYTNGQTNGTTNITPSVATPPGQYRPVIQHLGNRHNENRNNENRVPPAGPTKVCAHCAQTFTSNHKKQKYCSDNCRGMAWELRTGRTLPHRRVTN